MAGDAARRERIRQAALTVFARYGLRRATMADLAAAAGMSRPALYLVHPGKEAVFRDVAGHLLDGASQAAEAAWPPGLSAETGLAAALLAHDLPMFRLLAASPHAAEILADSGGLTADLHAAAEARLRRLLAERLGGPDADGLAAMLLKAAAGLKHAGGDEASYVADIHRLAALVAGRSG